MAAEAGGEREEEEEATGVLLYYKYAPVPDVSALVRFYGSDCAALGLLGRVRVAPDGVNVTIGGKMSSLEKHIATLKSMSLFAGTDFKLASCSHPSDERIAKECGCTSLSIRVVKELVTFRSNPLLKSPEISNAGRHLSAVEFHSVLQDVRNRLDSQSDMQNRQLLLLDARNLYETRIGRFQTPNVETLDPEIRQYSDLPAWIDEHSKKLHGKHVLMYCTGGIRCEMASAYIRSKGAGFENVFQLFGGIQRYLEQYPDGGYFKGKNFVFDHRISVGSKDADILGACLVCGSSFDDYSSRCRCMYCRMLVLVCYSCQGKSSAGSVCELCQKHGKGGQMVPLARDNQLQPGLPPDSSETIEIGSASLTYHAPSFPELSMRHGNNPSRKLRILCLHGFRQNASNFKGRTSSLAKKLRSIVEFVFIDAPHELAFIYHPRSSEQNHRHINLINPPLQDKWKKRFAWMIAPKSNYLDGPDCRAVDEPFDPLQYQQQTDGFEESYTYLKTVFSQMGPFDGILGFSQGAAMASLFCERQQRCCDTFVFRFAILCSGFSPTAMGLSKGIIRCPSLHIFGNIQGEDRQISCQASMELAGLFDEGSSMVIEHDMGHIIPTRSPYIDQMKDFLQRFL